MGRIEGKVTVITGGAGEIGAVAAKLFADEGSKVLLVDIDKKALEEAVLKIGRDSVSYVVADVSSPDQVQAYVNSAVERYGGIDIFLNNAGIEGLVCPITKYPVDIFDKVYQVNIRGVWLGLKYVIPVMAKRGGGSIVISSSFAGVSGTYGVSAYCCSKHAVIGIMKTAAQECASLNIRVNTINPSPVEGRMIQSLEDSYDAMLGAGDPTAGRLSLKEILTKSIPMGRYVTSDEVAKMMLFLASDESRYCTGSVYMIDGGRGCC